MIQNFFVQSTIILISNCNSSSNSILNSNRCWQSNAKKPWLRNWTNVSKRVPPCHQWTASCVSHYTYMYVSVHAARFTRDGKISVKPLVNNLSIISTTGNSDSFADRSERGLKRSTPIVKWCGNRRGDFPRWINDLCTQRAKLRNFDISCRFFFFHDWRHRLVAASPLRRDQQYRQVNPLGVASITLSCCNYRVTGRYANHRHAHSWRFH